MNLTKCAVDATVGVLLRLLCRVDSAQIGQVPNEGPLLLVINHINFLEVPVLYLYLRPRPLIAFVKAKNWDNPMRMDAPP